MVYKTKFEAEGFEVYEASAGQQGLSIAVDKQPDLILLDIMLPEGMNGFDVMQQMKLTQGLSHVPVLLTAHMLHVFRLLRSHYEAHISVL